MNPVEHRNPLLLKILVYTALALGVVSVPASAVANVKASHLAQQRADDLAEGAAAAEVQRVADGVAGCQRGNVFRQQVIDLGTAVEAFQSGQLDIVLPRGSGVQAVDRLRDPLDALLSKLHVTVARVVLIDCADVIVGAPAGTPPLPPD